ncbi:hypothetical protein SCUCBS95973_008285 [Sporothrix curviconia]|uniref:Inner centromere protein ARK-binding domain-containing protein n=1 Tax=Sporothrix curviconia TaxID=1260050 RepID=A0ABP0CMU3_9PEZI
MAMRGPRHPIGAAPWIVEERTTALHIAQSEVDEFMFSAKNELDWLNEHMADIFSENQINVADIFKTPGKLRGKTPRTARKTNKGDIRAEKPLTDVFSSTPKGAPNPFAVSKLTSLQQQHRRQSPTFTVAEDKPAPPRKSQSPQRVLPAKTAASTTSAATTKAKAAAAQSTKAPAAAPAPVAKPTKTAPSLIGSGYHGSQSQDMAIDGGNDDEDELAGDDMATQPFSQPTRPATPEAATRMPATSKAADEKHQSVTVESPADVEMSPVEMADHASPTQPTVDPTFHSAREEQTAVVPPAVPEAAKPSSPAADTEILSSSPFCPVQSPSSVAVKKQASPPKPMAPASPKRKPVPAPSSPLQSTTPACPPPRELLSAMGISAAPTASSPALAYMGVPPAAPTPPMAAIPAFIAEKGAAVTAAWEETDVEDDVVVYEGEAVIDDVPQGHDDVDQSVLRPVLDDEKADEGAEEEAEEEEEPSSPVRPVVRKSSMNFASLPARAPFTSNKSLGAGAVLARTGQAEPARPSYYNRPTGGKSLNNARPPEPQDDDDDDRLDEMDIDGQNTAAAGKDLAEHNKTYAQRLHDRISMLGKSQANAPRPSKSLAAFAQQQEAYHAAQQKSQQNASLSPKRTATSVAAPGAFPEDDDEEEEEEKEEEEEGDEDDDWIDPPPIVAAATTAPVAKTTKTTATTTTAATNAAEEVTEAVLPKQRQQDVLKKALAPVIPERTTSAVSIPTKSSSVPSLPTAEGVAHATAKPIAVSNPANPAQAALASALELDDRPVSPNKSPSRNYRDSPLKHVKNKLSSILKTSKGLLASSAALSAEGKSSLLSPSTTRLGLLMGPSTESLALKLQNDSASELARPDLSRQTSATTTMSTTSAASAASSMAIANTQESPVRSESPVRPNRKTRASVERERREQKHREKELKEVQRMAEQMGKLEKMREKEREKARVFVEDREKAAAVTEKPAQTPAQRELRGNKQPQPQQKVEEEEEEVEVEEEDDDIDILSQPPPPKPKTQTSSPARVAAKPTRTSPRKVKAQQAGEDLDMADAPSTSMLPPPPPAHSMVSTSSAVPRSAQAPRTIRRPTKPTKEVPSKTKQAKTVIRVNTSSSQHQHQHHQQQQQQSQFHPSNSILAASLHDTLAGPPQLKNKASTASLHTKPSLQSLKSSVSSTGRPKALELAAKRKEAEEREAQRKRDVKAEMERKRAALQEQEERRQEQQRQKEREREQAQAEAAAAKKAAAAAAQRQAAIEKAKQTRAPPPVQRTQLPSGGSGDYGRSEAQPPRPQSRLATAAGSTMHRSQEEQHRPVNAVLSHTAKALSKRPLPGADAFESQNHGRPGTAGGGHAAGGSNMPSYQHKDAKRIRMSEEFDENELEMGGHDVRVSSIKGPPELPSKSVFGNGYSTAPTNVSRDLFKSTVTAQHNKAGHPMDMAQVSKAAISFAPSGNTGTVLAAAVAAAASTSASQSTHKTPLRPAGTQLAGKSAAKSAAKSVGKSAAKSAAKSSPRFPNGDAIELPDIQTDDEDSEEEHVNAAPWADSPDLRRALMRQETVDPFQVFGPPGPLNMEEVFNKTKERWHKFRARTSSANWSGIDRLTEDDIRKDLAARDKIRREGGWSYDLGKDML